MIALSGLLLALIGQMEPPAEMPATPKIDDLGVYTPGCFHSISYLSPLKRVMVLLRAREMANFYTPEMIRTNSPSDILSSLRSLMGYHASYEQVERFLMDLDTQNYMPRETIRELQRKLNFRLTWDPQQEIGVFAPPTPE